MKLIRRPTLVGRGFGILCLIGICALAPGAKLPMNRHQREKRTCAYGSCSLAQSGSDNWGRKFGAVDPVIHLVDRNRKPTGTTGRVVPTRRSGHARNIVQAV